jgi:hypothetical protein
MSAWRFEFGFVPSTPVTQRLVLANPPVKLSSLERLKFWHGLPVPESLLESLNSLLLMPQLLCEAKIRWARGCDTYVDLFVERRCMRDIRVTVDLREPHLNFIADVALVANQVGWLGITGDGRIFRPSVRRFLAEIHQSPAMRWIRGSMESLLADAGSMPNPQRGLNIH